MAEIDGRWEIYRLLAADINRYRDWPIRVLTFTSALHFALIAAIAVKQLTLQLGARLVVSALLALLFWFTIRYFRNCHHEYVRSRNTQVRLNRLLKLDELAVSGVQVLPLEWFREREVSLKTGLWGWGFYGIYALVVLALSLIVVWQWGFEWSSSVA